MTATPKPKTARELKEERLRAVSAKMSELGGELAKYRFAPHPNQKQISAQIDALREEYRRVDAEP
jgi:hypothetical protein